MNPLFLNESSEKAQGAFKIAKMLHQAGETALFAGGCVRDALMQKTPSDFDIATTAKPETVEKMFKKTIPVGKQFGVILVVLGEENFEVATFRSEGNYEDGRHPSQVSFTTPEKDALRRDFTVNGLFYDPVKEVVVDYVGGRSDIEKKVIRAIGKPEDRFSEDKLRLLRAVRFASNLNFQIESATWKAVQDGAEAISCVSQERIRDELVKILIRPHPERGLDLLSESGLLARILPEVEKLKGVQQPPEHHPEGDVYTHTRMLLERLEHPSLTLALGALFHDLGKPDTYAVRDGKITFYDHAVRGAEMAAAVMERLRFSREQIRDVGACVRNHMKFMDVQKMRPGKLKRWVSETTFNDELEMHRIDCLSSHGNLENYQFLRKKLVEFNDEDLKPKPLANGHDLMAWGVEPGPKMKWLLEELYELQLEQKITDKKSAKLAAEKLIREDPS